MRVSEGPARIELLPVAIPLKSPGFAQQMVNHVPVVEHHASVATVPGQHQEQFPPAVKLQLPLVNLHLYLLADEPGRNRIANLLDPDGAARTHAANHLVILA